MVQPSNVRRSCIATFRNKVACNSAIYAKNTNIARIVRLVLRSHVATLLELLRKGDDAKSTSVASRRVELRCVASGRRHAFSRSRSRARVSLGAGQAVSEAPRTREARGKGTDRFSPANPAKFSREVARRP